MTTQKQSKTVVICRQAIKTIQDSVDMSKGQDYLRPFPLPRRRIIRFGG